MRRIFLLLFVMTCSMVFVSCGNDEENTAAIEGLLYEGNWMFSSYNNFIRDGNVKTTLQITSSGEMIWKIPERGTYKAQLHVHGNNWADITYNGKTYSAEMYVIEKENLPNEMVINVNGDEDLIVKDFPFDGKYVEIMED